MKNRLFQCVCVVLLGSIAAQGAEKPTTEPIGPNLVQNGDFEKGGTGWPFVASGADANGEVTRQSAHAGSQSLKITNKSPFAPNVFARVFHIVGGLEPFTTYRISCWAKGKNVGICWIGGGPGWFHRKRFPEGSFDWTYIDTLWNTDAGGGDFELMVATESTTDALYIDDIKMEPISADVPKRDAALAAFHESIVQQERHYRALQEMLVHQPQARQDPVIQLGLYTARRYIDRVLDPKLRQSSAWSSAQMEEVGQVLNETEMELKRWQRSQRVSSPQPQPGTAGATIRDGLFYTDTTHGNDKPWFYYGMGHFDQVYKDLPNYERMGVSIVQDGRVGPNGMNEDGTLREKARRLLADVERADLYGVKVDYLLSPHYFPDWAWNKASKELQQGGGLGFLYFNIDHPVAKDAIGRWAEQISKALKNHPALFSICLSNEPVYDDSGRNPQTLPLYQQYLQQRHKDISTLNDLYGASYTSFSDIKPPPGARTKDEKKNRAFYDWCRFNQKHFADWHAWMKDIVKKNLPNTPVHAKIMVFYAMDQDKVSYGVDPEAFCDVTDIAGCDAYAFPQGAETYEWHGQEFWYDLLNSFRNQPVFNSENHIIPDSTGPVHFPLTMTRAQFWQGALHHQAVTTTWVWEEAEDPTLAGSIFFRPANVYGAARAFLDLGRHADQVAAINLQPPEFALLYSQPSIFWEEGYKSNSFNIYTHLNFLGQKITFVSENMLAEGRVPKVKWIVLPQATHVEDSTVAALEKFAASGGKILFIGDNNLAFDAYHRKRALPKTLTDHAISFTFAKDADNGHRSLADLLIKQGTKVTEAADLSSGQLAWNVEYRTVEAPGRMLLPVISFNTNRVIVKFAPLNGMTAFDALSGESVDLQKLELEPMVPHLLVVTKPRD